MKACAPWRADATVIGANIFNRGREEIQTAMDDFHAMRKRENTVPSALFQRLDVLEPAQNYKNCHALIMPAAKTASEAIKAAEAAASPGARRPRVENDRRNRPGAANPAIPRVAARIPTTFPSRREPSYHEHMTIDDLPPLATVIAAHGLAPKKRLGQNFLLDLNLTAKIARLAGDLTKADILEVGPGPGGLTRGLLAEGARRVLAIEKDPRCLPALAEIAQAYPGRLDLLNADALDADAFARLTPPIRVCANLPYNMGTELLLRWLVPGTWPPPWTSLTLMFQREVADRIVARPGSKTYGRLAVLSRWLTEARIVMDLPPEVFSPPPKIRSAVVRLEARETPLHPAEPALLSEVTRRAFGQRRKMMRAALRGMVEDVEHWLTGAGIAPTARAETVDIEGFCALARGLADRRRGGAASARIIGENG